MRISWITESETPATVDYGTSSGSYVSSATGSTNSYTYDVYKSGQIHNVDIGPLKPNTVYYYRCGEKSDRELSFKTAPASFPIKFAVVGDFGQTEHTESILQHISQSNYDMLLLPDDLSYADTWQPRWDSFGRIVEPVASQRPWMVTQGNHEVEEIPVVHMTTFTAYNARWRMPYEESGSTSNLYYSFNVAGVHVIMLGSFTDFDPSSAQYKWLHSDLAHVDRSKTLWLFALLHAPWYSTNMAHRGEAESVDMKKYMEGVLYDARVDGLMFLIWGCSYMDPQPEISKVREASFGHGQLEVVNATHAQWTWHRNDDGENVESDSTWITSLHSESSCKV
ncbi:Probable purple acid phosphatase 20 [Linum perenne]